MKVDKSKVLTFLVDGQSVLEMAGMKILMKGKESRKKEEDALKSEQILLDATLMQNLQDRFCDANNLYLRCLDKNRTEVTKTYGSKEELEYLGSVIDMDRHIGL